jgi:Tfp pilus assembly protein PilX
MTSSKSPLRRHVKSRGISLIIVLIMLIIIGITASSAMRSATSEQRVTNNARMEGTAQQYAEAGLRYCEGQFAIATALRSEARLQTANIVATPLGANTPSAWENVANWAAGSAILVTVPAGVVSDGNTPVPATLPQCLAELQTMGNPPFTVTVITARGFSPDYAANGDGTTKQGAVVWLQSIINAL